MEEHSVLLNTNHGAQSSRTKQCREAQGTITLLNDKQSAPGGADKSNGRFQHVSMALRAWGPLSIEFMTEPRRGLRLSRVCYMSGDPGSSPGQIMWNLWWTKWHWDRFSPSTTVSFPNHSISCSSLIIIHQSGLVQRPNSGRGTKWT
jgi:hypothetical protein